MKTIILALAITAAVSPAQHLPHPFNAGDRLMVSSPDPGAGLAGQVRARVENLRGRL